MNELTPQRMLAAFRMGVFPMASSRDAGRVFWVDPEERGVLSPDRFHLGRRLFRVVRGNRFEVTVDRCFADIIRACAMTRVLRDQETWINGAIERVFVSLARAGHAHSVETWHDGRLVGGLYGCAIGAAFFGESMFSTETDASKVAFAHLVARLRMGGFVLLDTQDVTEHLARFGVTGIPRPEYKRRLADAVDRQASFIGKPDPALLEAEFRLMAQADGPSRPDGS